MSQERMDLLIETYLRMKAALDAKEKTFAEQKKVHIGKMEKILAEVTKHVNLLGVEMLKVSAGKASKTKKTYVSVKDWDDVLCFAIKPLFPKATDEQLVQLVELSNMNFIKKGVMKTEVIGYMTNNGDALPPGCSYSAERVLSITK